MNKHITLLIQLLLLFYLIPDSVHGENEEQGFLLNKQGAFQGYTLFAPIGSTTTYLIDMEGRVVHQWESDYPPGQSVYLLENGHLLRTANPGPGFNTTFHGRGAGGRVQEFDWKGNLLWDFKYSSNDYLLHHDIEPLPNGNVLMIAWVRKSTKEAKAAGRNPERLGYMGLWADCIIEVKPRGKKRGKIVWEWHAWDHLIQELHRSKANYGKVADHPERIDINHLDWKDRLSEEEKEKLRALGYLGGPKQRSPKETNPDMMHINSIDYNETFDQVILSVMGFNEIWVIDHSTNTKEAARHKGGKYGKGGDLLYRWGNPLAYKTGEAKDQQLFAQHDAHWIPQGFKGAGNILVFNNGLGRRGNYSTVDEIVPPMDEKGFYFREAPSRFGPAMPIWSFCAENKSDFYSMHISGAQRLPNGNTLICAGEQGLLFEVTPENELVWKYVNPVFGEPPGMAPPRGKRGGPMQPPGKRPAGPPPAEPINSVFRAYRYGLDYPGLAGKKMTPGKPIKAKNIIKTKVRMK